MTDEKILEIIEQYRRVFFKHNGILKKKYEGFLVPDTNSCMSHCYSMLDDIETFITEGNKEKASRWLGFIQGCLWSKGFYCIEDLKDHNRD